MTFNPDDEWYKIESPKYNVNIRVRNEYVIEAPTVVDWMNGRRVEYIIDFCKSRGYIFR